MDRITGKVSAISLPEFDPLDSNASGYRDYVAYFGVSDDGKKLLAIVMQLGRPKPILKKLLLEPREDLANSHVLLLDGRDNRYA